MGTEAAQAVDATAWREHCRSAVRKFVMNAVVIDNEPCLPGCNPEPHGRPPVAQIDDDGMSATGADDTITPATDSAPEPADDTDTPAIDSASEDKEINGHPLDVQAISDAFADQAIACAFVLPKEKDPDETVMKRVLVAAIPADIVVIDWKLRNGNHKLTLEILKKIAEKDASENGRLRLICVYTGEPQTAEITRDAITALKDGGLVFDTIDEDAGRARGKYHCLQVLSKHDEAGVEELPNQLIDAMTDIADGLLPAFSLAAVAAVRKNVHHIVSRFSQDLDGPYVANRMITSPPGEVAELMRELFISECDTAVGLEKVADNFLEPDKIMLWLDVHNQPKSVMEFGKCKNKINRDFFNILLEQGLWGGKVTMGGNEIKFPEDKRVLVSQALHGDEARTLALESSFARHVSLKREAFGKTKLRSENGDWVPSLTLGTILRQNKGTKEDPKYTYYYCLTPACDTVRLMGDVRNFLLLEVEEQSKANLIVTDENGEDKRLFIEPKPTNIRAFQFRGCKFAGRVKAEVNTDTGKNLFIFKTENEGISEFLWLGEVRRNRANRDMANLNREWLRFGIKDSEYLRLAGRGNV